MRNKRFTNLILILALVLLAGGLVFTVANRAKAEGDGVNGTETAVAAVGTTFTYQGNLEKNGSPVNDTCDMTFRLRDSSGFQVGTNRYENNVTVSDGLFSVDLDFGDAVFTGDDRLLEIAVQCSGDSSSTVISPNVVLNAAPYALSLRPGATISGTVSGDVLDVTNSATAAGTTAVHGIAGSATTAGAPSHEAGVMGESKSGFGVIGFSDDRDGVFGFSNAGWGVYGYSTNSVGVYGWTADSNSYGVYSKGNAHVEGKLTWKAAASYISIPAASFQPADNGYTYSNYGNELVPGDSASRYYVAPVQLPHGATVTNITFYWTDLTTLDDGTVALWRTNLDGSESLMGTASTSGSAGTFSSSAPAITNPVIDNSQYSYYLYLDLPQGGTIKAHGVTIEYTTTQPY